MSTCRHVVPPRDPDVWLGPLLLGPRLRPPQHQQVSTSLVLELQTIIRQCFHYHGEGRNVLNLKVGAQVGAFFVITKLRVDLRLKL